MKSLPRVVNLLFVYTWHAFCVDNVNESAGEVTL